MERHEVAFFGKISAAMTHDIRNVLAIIRESAGLMQDLLNLCGDRDFPYHEKFGTLLAGIQAQVNRGVEMATHFNRFAHSMDQPIMEVEANAMVHQVAQLTQRFARLRKIQLVAVAAIQPITLRVDAFALYRLLGEAIGVVLQHAVEGDTIAVQAGTREDGVEFSILAQLSGGPAEGPAGAASELPEAFRDLVEQLEAQGGRWSWVTGPEGKGLALLVPASAPASR